MASVGALAVFTGGIACVGADALGAAFPTGGIACVCAADETVEVDGVAVGVVVVVDVEGVASEFWLTVGVAIGVPQLVQNFVPSSIFFPQFVQKAIFTSSRTLLRKLIKP